MPYAFKISRYYNYKFYDRPFNSYDFNSIIQSI
jgi:hypothetical protein